MAVIPVTQKMETGRSRVQDQPGLHRNTPFKKKSKEKGWFCSSVGEVLARHAGGPGLDPSTTETRHGGLHGNPRKKKVILSYVASLKPAWNTETLSKNRGAVRWLSGQRSAAELDDLSHVG